MLSLSIRASMPVDMHVFYVHDLLVWALEFQGEFGALG